jgi:two-component system nitrogen regulation response regulator GlnG
MPELYRHVIQTIDRVVLEEVLKHVKGNQVHASELLGMSRTTLRSKLAHLQGGNPPPTAPDTKA